MVELSDPLESAEMAQRIWALFAPMRDCHGAAFVYGLLDHRVHDANIAAGVLWAFARDEFVGRADGVARLWVNPLDWQRHGEIVRERGACLGLSTRLRGWDGRLTRCWISSLRLIAGAEPVVVSYARPVAGSQGAAIDEGDLASLALVLDSPAAQHLRRTLTPAMLLNPSPAPISTTR